MREVQLSPFFPSCSLLRWATETTRTVTPPRTIQTKQWGRGNKISIASICKTNKKHKPAEAANMLAVSCLSFFEFLEHTSTTYLTNGNTQKSSKEQSQILPSPPHTTKNQRNNKKNLHWSSVTSLKVSCRRPIQTATGQTKYQSPNKKIITAKKKIKQKKK